MTDFEIEYVKKNLNYLKTTYGVHISPEDFIHDMDVASMVQDSSTASVNYHNIYKKYLRIVALEAYKNNFTITDVNGVELSNKKNVSFVLFCYEIMMTSMLKSSIFGEYGNIPVAEVLFAGMNQEKYVLEITPDVLPKTCVDEFLWKNKNIDYDKIGDTLLIKMYTYMTSAQKEFTFKRIAILYTCLLQKSKKTFHIVKRMQYHSIIHKFLSYMTSILQISKNELINKLKMAVAAPGNYTESVNSILTVYKKDVIFTTLRNQFEEDESKLMDSIERYKFYMNNDMAVNNIPTPFTNDVYNENNEGGNENV